MSPSQHTSYKNDQLHVQRRSMSVAFKNRKQYISLTIYVKKYIYVFKLQSKMLTYNKLLETIDRNSVLCRSTAFIFMFEIF